MSNSNNTPSTIVTGDAATKTAIETADTNNTTALATNTTAIETFETTWEAIFPIDGVTRAALTIDYAHHEAHAGSMYLISGADTLNISDTLGVLITTPNTNSHAHLIGVVRSTGEANVKFYENPDTPVAGAAVTPYNKNRNSIKTAATTINILTSTTGYGTLIEEQHFGAGSKTGGEGRASEEWILKKNEEYILLLTSESVGNDVSFVMQWYEHTDLTA